MENGNSFKTALCEACQALLRPVASVLLNSGMTWKEFSDLAKAVFVSVATEEFGIKGRPTNVSRTSILTGISRKEVKRQRELLRGDTQILPTKTTDATRLLSAWHQDPTYLESNGGPAPLRLTGPVPSFHTLFETYGGDTQEQTLLKELKNVGSIEFATNKQVLAKRRYHMPVQTDIGHLQYFCAQLRDHGKTLCNNLYGSDAQKRIEGAAISYEVDSATITEFREFVDQAGQQFLEEVDGWLNKHSARENDATETPIRLGLGIYAIEETTTKGIST